VGKKERGLDHFCTRVQEPSQREESSEARISFDGKKLLIGGQLLSASPLVLAGGIGALAGLLPRVAAAPIAGQAVGAGVDKLSGAADLRDAAKAQTDAVLASQQTMINDARKQTSAAVTSANNLQVRDQARARQQQLSASGQSFRDTILTGPLGLPDAGANTSRKTLLGM
jgi:hypothetical protein